jgi:hypothetical protein
MRKTSRLKKGLVGLCVFFLLSSGAGCQPTAVKIPAEPPGSGIPVPQVVTDAGQDQTGQPANETGGAEVLVKKGQSYSTRDEVAAYIKQFHDLPPNYITKAEAQKLGWDNAKGNLWGVTSQKSIGGDRFGNREGLLPKAEGRQYYECDINYYGGYRGPERVVYSNDGLIFYSDDHYATFKKLY